MKKELSSFAARLRENIQGRDAALRRPDSAARCPYQELEFNSLALELFSFQFEHNATYRKICEARNRTPQTVEHWTQIPAVPTTAFKELELSCIPPDERTAVFHSSGTTEQKPSRHLHNRESLAIYETSLWSWFERNVLRSVDGSSACLENTDGSLSTRGQAVRAPFTVICLTPPPEQVPHSSLVHMFETICQKLDAAQSAFVGKIAADGTWALDFDTVLAALNHSTLNAQPSTVLLGSAFSFVHLLDYLGERDLRVALPAGSRVLETGGYKNRSRTLPKAELHARMTERLGIAPENVVCEYGMSELSSQAYDGGAAMPRGREFCGRAAARPYRVFQFPPWARAQIVSPETGHPVAEDETGLIRVLDLANVFSVLAVQTEDLGIRRGDGFELIGRAQFAEPRGCSLMSASIVNRQS